MKTSTLFKTLLVMSLSIGLFSCTDDEDDAPDSTTPSQSDAVPQFVGSDATLVAINTRTTTDTPIGPLAIDLGTAVAVFFEEGSSNLLNVGAVTCEGEALNRFDNNSYVYTPGATSPSGLDFGSSASWTVEGGNGFPALNATTQIGFPNLGSITSGSSVVKADGYVLTVTGLSAADSVIYNIGGVLKTLSGNQGSCTFSAAELENLPAGPNIAQASAYRFENEEFQGKSVYFVNQTVVTQMVEVQ